MEQMESTSGILNLMIQPAFTVKDGVVDLVNEAARKYLLEPGMSVSDLLMTGKLEYKEFEEGRLYLTLRLADTPYGASVNRMGSFDLFTLEQEQDRAELQAMALAAQEFRNPLSNVMSVADQLFPVTDQADDPVVREQIARINRGLFQMLRIVGNMSDAYRYCQQTEPRMSIQNVTEIMAEIFEHSAALLEHSGVTLTFTNLESAVLCLVDKEKLERAVHNIVSNAVKFSGKNSSIHAKLSRKGNMLYLSVEDNGMGIHPEVQGNVHFRYSRQPRLEDSRFGIGLGMVLIRSAAAAHGGTVLVDHPGETGTRVTLSIAINQNAERVVRTNALHIDYAGERNHALIELSDVLDAGLYESDKIN